MPVLVIPPDEPDSAADQRWASSLRRSAAAHITPAQAIRTPIRMPKKSGSHAASKSPRSMGLVLNMGQSIGGQGQAVSRTVQGNI